MLSRCVKPRFALSVCTRYFASTVQSVSSAGSNSLGLTGGSEQPTFDTSTNSLVKRLHELNIGNISCKTAGISGPQPVEYKLPTCGQSIVYKKTIIDPLHSHTVYELPTIFSIIQEKVTPSLQHVVPIEDPNPLQKIIDQGAPVIEKHCMPWLMRVRRKKMKKHKLKKTRKRNIFLHRKLAEIKNKKKEALMVKFEKEQLDKGKAFDAEKYIGEEIETAKRGGWEINILENRQKQL